MKTATLLLLTAFACGSAAAAGPDEPVKELAPVKVNSIKDPEMRSYRSAWAGLEAFDEYRALAPQASLRFQMTHRDGRLAGPDDGLSLRLATDEDSRPIPIDAGGRFTIERDKAAYRADATFILNKKSKTFTARPDVRTPGLPDKVRRLGDLRLECRVMIAIVKEQIPFLAKAALNTVLLTTDWCGKEKVNFSYPSGQKLVSATIRAGGRVQELDAEEWHYMVPVGDRDWPDDALIELRFESADAKAEAP